MLLLNKVTIPSPITMVMKMIKPHSDKVGIEVLSGAKQNSLGVDVTSKKVVNSSKTLTISVLRPLHSHSWAFVETAYPIVTIAPDHS
jgi:hypothetical protein